MTLDWNVGIPAGRGDFAVFLFTHEVLQYIVARTKCLLQDC